MMKWLARFSLILLLCSAMAFEKPTSVSSSSVAVVELFTSQGCSSCPAADELLGKLVNRTTQVGKQIIALSYHVSYWNHLGWKDPYSSEVFTQRQKRYAEVMQLQSIYTPQMIVNGEYELVGSDERKLENALGKAWKESPGFEIEIKAEKKDGEVMVHYNLHQTPINKLLNLALVEPFVKNDVPSGENKGRALSHYNVVRQLKTMAASREGEMKMNIPKALGSNNFLIILCLQDPETMHITNAISITVR